MNKLEIINQYFELFRDKNMEAHRKIFNSKFGIRTFLGNLIFKIENIERLLENYTLMSYEITDLEERINIVHITVTINYELDSITYSKYIVIKFVFKKDKIVRVFEAIKKVGYNRIMCIVTYDGSTFSGFQRQPNLITVQGELEKALWYLTKENITIHSSGRTDKGVHAINQIFHFDTLSKIKPKDFARVLKSYLPDSIYLKSSNKVHPTFHSRYDSYSKEYIYKLNLGEYDPIQRNYEWNVTNINVEVLKEELKSIIGIHNFTSFTKTKEDKTMIRTILDVKFRKDGNCLYISIIGNGFLRYMVRYIVGTAVEISKGEIKHSLIEFIGYKNSSKVLWKAPSSGLYLQEVKYID